MGVPSTDLISDDAAPSYEEDEGVGGMGDLGEDRQYSNMSTAINCMPSASWGFDRVAPRVATASRTDSDEDIFNQANSDQETDEIDLASNNPAMGDDSDDRLAEDFGDSMVDERNSPIVGITIGDEASAGASGPMAVSRGMTPEEDPTDEMPELVGASMHQEQAKPKAETATVAEKKEEDVKMD